MARLRGRPSALDNRCFDRLHPDAEQVLDPVEVDVDGDVHGPCSALMPVPDPDNQQRVQVDDRGRSPRPTLRAWSAEVPAYFDIGCVSNGGTEAINLITERTRRLAHDIRTFEQYRLRILLAASGTRT
jgi:Transposase